MIANYAPPALVLTQSFATSPATGTRRGYACIIGPRFILSRAGKETIPLTPFAAEGATLAFDRFVGPVRTAIGNHSVDQDSVHLYGKDLEADVANFDPDASGSDAFRPVDLSRPSVLRLTNHANSASVAVQGSGLSTQLHGRAVKVGDILHVTDDSDVTRRRRVTGLLGVSLASDFGTDGADGAFANNQFNPPEASGSSVVIAHPTGWSIAATGTLDALVRGSSLNGRYGERFILTVTTGGAPATAVMNVTSASGLWAASNVATTDDSGSFIVTDGETAGITFTIEPPVGTTDLVEGQQFIVDVFGAYHRLTAGTNIVGSTDDNANPYRGNVDTTYMLRVKTGVSGASATGAVLSISDTAGVDAPYEITITDNTVFDVGTRGIQCKFTIASGAAVSQNGLRTGDVYYTLATASKESTTVFDKVVLDGPAFNPTTFASVATGLPAVLRSSFTGIIPVTQSAIGEAYTSDTAGVTYESGLAVRDTSRSSGYQWLPFADGVGNVGVGFRATPPLESDALHACSTVADILQYAGADDADNPLGSAVAAAFAGGSAVLSSTSPAVLKVYVLPTGGASAADYANALNHIRNVDFVTELVPISERADVRTVIIGHVNAMSAGRVKNFRGAWLPVSSPGRYTLVGADSNNVFPTATVSNYGGANRLVVLASGDVDFTALNIVAGDIFQFEGGGASAAISEVLSSGELILQTGLSVPVSPAAPFRIIKEDTAQSQISYLQGVASAVGQNHRICLVWSEGGVVYTGDTPEAVPSSTIAGSIAGIRAATISQQGLTGVTVPAISSATPTYSKYTEEDLNAIASHGVLIVSQPYSGAACTIRHQLTTATDGGVLTYEANIRNIADEATFLIKDMWNNYPGRKNVTPRFMQRLDEEINVALTAATKVPVDADYDPLIFSFRDVAVRRAAVANNVIVSGTVAVPTPLGELDVNLNFESA